MTVSRGKKEKVAVWEVLREIERFEVEESIDVGLEVCSESMAETVVGFFVVFTEISLLLGEGVPKHISEH